MTKKEPDGQCQKCRGGSDVRTSSFSWKDSQRLADLCSRCRQDVGARISDVAPAKNVQIEHIEIYAGKPEGHYDLCGKIKVSVTAATALSKTPTIEDVNLKIREEASRLGANAVIEVVYSRGVSALSWKALRAQGSAVILKPLLGTPSATGVTERLHMLKCLMTSGEITETEHAIERERILGEL